MEAIIDIRSISFSYPQSKRLVLNDCSLQIMAGEITSFLGPNGAGKSTLYKLRVRAAPTAVRRHILKRKKHLDDEAG